MKPAKSMRPPLLGSPTRNPCILTMSGVASPSRLRLRSIALSTPTVWVLVSPNASMLSFCALSSSGGGTVPADIDHRLAGRHLDGERDGKIRAGQFVAHHVLRR